MTDFLDISQSYPWFFWTSAGGAFLLFIALPLVWRSLRTRARNREGFLPSRRRLCAAGLLLVCSATAAAGAVTRPTWNGMETRPDRASAGIVILLDCSQSIVAQNTKSVGPRSPHLFHPVYGRLGSIKVFLREIILSLEEGYTIVPIAFAGLPVPYPPTQNYDRVLDFLSLSDDTISPYSFSEGVRGTDIAQALTIAVTVFGFLDSIETRVIILISDGDVSEGVQSLPGDIRAAAEHVRSNDITLFSVLVGTPGVGAPVPNRESPDGWHHRIAGDTRIELSEPKPWLMQEIASVAGSSSRYHLAENHRAVQRALRRVLADVEVLSTREVETKKDATSLFVLVALCALLGAWIVVRGPRTL